MKKLISIAALCITLTSCAHKTLENKIVKPQMTPFEKSMSKAASVSARALDTLSKVNNASKSIVLTPNQVQQELWQNGKTISSLSGITSIHWNGTLKAFINSFSKHIPQWHVVKRNVHPDIDVFLTLNMDNVSYQDVLAEVGAQSGETADVIIDTRNHKIIFVYRTDTGGIK